MLVKVDFSESAKGKTPGRTHFPQPAKSTEQSSQEFAAIFSEISRVGLFKNNSTESKHMNKNIVASGKRCDSTTLGGTGTLNAFWISMFDYARDKGPEMLVVLTRIFQEYIA